MPEDTPAQTQASKPTETKEIPEKIDTSTATAEVRIRYTADTHAWVTPEAYWPAPYLTHYGASSVRLLPQYSDPKFIGENQTFLDNWAKDAQTRGLAEMTIGGYRRNLNAYASYLGPLSILPIGVPQLTSYMDHLKATRRLEGKSLAPHVSALASLYDFLSSQEIIHNNPLPSFRRRFLAVPLREAHKKRLARRQLLSVDHMRLLVHSIPDLQTKTMAVLLVKTGVRGGELVSIDVPEIDWKHQTITLKPFPKRTNNVVFFDDETEYQLGLWVDVRRDSAADPKGPLFLAEDRATRMAKGKVGKVVSAAARLLGLHNPKGDLKARFTPHACRHWFSTHLRRAGMEAEFIQFLRGDSPGRTLDTYLHIDWEEVHQDYVKRIPQLGLRESQSPEFWANVKARVEAANKAVLRLAELGPPVPPEPKVRPVERETLASTLGTPPTLETGDLEATEGTSETPEPSPAELPPTAALSSAPVATSGPGFKAHRNGPKASQATLHLRRILRKDRKAGTQRPRAEYLSLLGAGTSRTPQAAAQILNREANRVLGHALAREGNPLPTPRKTRRKVGKRTAPRSSPTTTKGPRAGRQPSPDVLKLREELRRDAESNRIRPRAQYLAILAPGTKRTKHAADQILSRDAKRILGKPLGREATPPHAAPRTRKVAPLSRHGRQPGLGTVKLREAMLGDAAAKLVRPRAEYLEILASGGPRSDHAADQILNREAKRILGKPIGRQTTPVPAPVVPQSMVTLKTKPVPAPVSVERLTGRRPNATTLELRQRIATDTAAGRLRGSGVYVKWLQAKTKVSPGGARQMVAKQMARITELTTPVAVMPTPRRPQVKGRAATASRRNR